MRDIKFRAWCLDYKVMDNYFYINPTGVVYEGANRSYDTPNIEIEENPNLIVMQFTGLQDKNGVDIYEGDILLVINKSYNYNDKDNEKRSVSLSRYADSEQYDDNIHFGLNLGGLLLVDCVDDGSLVIGNIYENPELLK